MARSNYSFHKRQKELARKKKKDEKRKRKLEKRSDINEENQDPSQNEENQDPSENEEEDSRPVSPGD